MNNAVNHTSSAGLHAIVSSINTITPEMMRAPGALEALDEIEARLGILRQSTCPSLRESLHTFCIAIFPVVANAVCLNLAAYVTCAFVVFWVGLVVVWPLRCAWAVAGALGDAVFEMSEYL